MSHWNTFAGQQMFALLMLAAFLFFAPPARRRWIWLGCAALMCIAILLAETRAVWIGLLAGGLYLLWFWNRWAVAAVPVLVAAGYLVAPPIIQDRVNSLLHPTGVDSNAFRVVTWRTGLRMIEAHPVFGIGPEGPKYHFADWIPADVPRPLPSGWYGHLQHLPAVRRRAWHPGSADPAVVARPDALRLLDRPPHLAPRPERFPLSSPRRHCRDPGRPGGRVLRIQPGR